MQIRLANTRGFCAGVDRAIEIVRKVLEQNGSPVYVKHEVVHNKTVVNELKGLGAVFVEEIEDVPTGEIVIYSAHGVSKVVQKDSEEKHLEVYDATCPLVSKVHAEVIKYSKLGYECILIGHQNHPEVEGTMGQFDASFGGSIYLVENVDDVNNLEVNNSAKLAYVTQTTLSIDDTKNIIDVLKKKFPNIKGPIKEDICYATTNRQDAVKKIASECEMFFVIGSDNSSNSKRLVEVAKKAGCNESYLINSNDQLPLKEIVKCNKIGLTSGASAPEKLVQDFIHEIKKHVNISIEEFVSTKENVTFKLPSSLN